MEAVRSAAWFVCLILGFETGDLIGWGRIESDFNSLNVWLVTSPV